MSNVCARCGSSKIIPDVQVIDKGPNGHGDLQVTILLEPHASIFKGRQYIPLRARVCGDCGFTELFVKDPELIWNAYVKSRKGFV